MYVYQVTNLVNNKIYIGITNNYQKRWSNHRCCNCKSSLLAKAIQKYGVDNFKFEILYSNLSIEEASEKEIELIANLNTLAPNGYNLAKGGMYTNGVQKIGAENSNAHLTAEEAQYIKDHRDQPMYVLYDDFSEKISYSAFRDVYHHRTYTNLIPSVEPYPFNLEFSNQFTSNNKLDYPEVVALRNQYAQGIYWREAYKDFQNIITDEWSFWNIYYGNKYKLVMPEVFTEENRKLHSKHKNELKSGANNGRAKLTENDVREIRRLHAEKVSNSEIYKLYPQVSTTSIRNIINRKTWINLD